MYYLITYRQETHNEYRSGNTITKHIITTTVKGSVVKKMLELNNQTVEEDDRKARFSMVLINSLEITKEEYDVFEKSQFDAFVLGFIK